MILDNFLLLSGAVSAAGVLSGQAVAGTGVSVLSTNTIDTASLTLGSNQVADLGVGTGIQLVFGILAAPTGGTTVQFQLIQATDAALTTSIDVLTQTDAIAIASLPINTLVALRVGWVAPLTPKRYLGARYVLVGAIASMAVVASITKDVQQVRNMLYRSGFAIL